MPLQITVVFLQMYPDARSIARPLVVILMGFVELPVYILKLGLGISFKEEKCLFTRLLVYL